MKYVAIAAFIAMNVIVPCGFVENKFLNQGNTLIDDVTGKTLGFIIS